MVAIRKLRTKVNKLSQENQQLVDAVNTLVESIRPIKKIVKKQFHIVKSAKHEAAPTTRTTGYLMFMRQFGEKMKATNKPSGGKEFVKLAASKWSKISSSKKDSWAEKAKERNSKLVVHEEAEGRQKVEVPNLRRSLRLLKLGPQN